MNLAMIITSIVLLGILAFQDFRERRISWFLLPLLMGAFVFSGLQSNDLSHMGRYFAVNFCFVVLQIGVLTVYFSVKNKKLTNVVNQYIGIGDLLFFVVLCAGFSPVNFILFYCASLVLSLMSFMGYRFFFRNGSKEIPLAGLFSLFLIAVVAVDSLSGQINFYDDGILINMFS